MAAQAIDSELADLTTITLATLRSSDDEVLLAGVAWLLSRIDCQDERSETNKQRPD